MVPPLRGIQKYLNVADIKKYIHYIFESAPFRPDFDAALPDPKLRQIAQQIRGATRGPAIMIHGIMPRAGTVYVGQLLRLHPDLHAFPRDWWEVPFLQMSGNILRLQEQFLVNHRHNRGKVGQTTFLTLFGSALVAHLHAATPQRRRMLLKVPSVEYLHYFWSMYPHEHLLVLTRDGRDVVESTVKTWPQIPFFVACRRWRRAAEMVATFHAHHAGSGKTYWVARFEDAVERPARFVRDACRQFGLNEEKYPFSKIDSIRIRGSSQLRDAGKVDWAPKKEPEGFHPIGYWRDWPEHKKWIFKRIAGEMLIELNYAEGTDW